MEATPDSPKNAQPDSANASLLFAEFAKFAPAFVAFTAIGAALAFYIGWTYQKSYIEEWGLPFSAFSYSPYELMIASTTTLLWAATPSLVWIVATIARAMFVPSPHRLFWRAVLGVVIGLALSGFLIWRITDHTALGLSLTWTGFVGAAPLGLQAEVFATRRLAEQIAFSALICLGIFMMLVIVAPRSLGRYDAQQDREHLDRLPRIELALRRTLGLDDEHVVETQLVTGSWLSLPRFSGHLHCGEILAQRGVQDGHTIPGRIPRAGGGVSAAA